MIGESIINRLKGYLLLAYLKSGYFRLFGFQMNVTGGNPEQGQPSLPPQDVGRQPLLVASCNLYVLLASFVVMLLAFIGFLCSLWPLALVYEFPGSSKKKKFCLTCQFWGHYIGIRRLQQDLQDWLICNKLSQNFCELSPLICLVWVLII